MKYVHISSAENNPIRFNQTENNSFCITVFFYITSLHISFPSELLKKINTTCIFFNTPNSMANAMLSTAYMHLQSAWLSNNYNIYKVLLNFFIISITRKNFFEKFNHSERYEQVQAKKLQDLF